MDCKHCEKLLDDAIFAPKAASDAQNASDLQEHLNKCLSCRQHSEAMKELGQSLSGIEELAEELPDDAFERVRARAMAGAMAKERQTRCDKKPTWSFGEIIQIPRWAWGLGVAALVLIGFGIFTFMTDSTERGGEQIAAHPARPASSQLTAKTSQSKPEEPVTLAALTTQFEQLKSSDAGVSQEFLNKLLTFIADDAAGLHEKMNAEQLLVDTYAELGERDLERVAFERYLDLVEKRDGKEKAAKYVRAKANHAFSKEQNYLRGLAYYDLIVTRHPGTKEAGHARFMVGKYYDFIKEPARAVG